MRGCDDEMVCACADVRVWVGELCFLIPSTTWEGVGVGLEIQVVSWQAAESLLVCFSPLCLFNQSSNALDLTSTSQADAKCRTSETQQRTACPPPPTATQIHSAEVSSDTAVGNNPGAVAKNVNQAKPTGAIAVHEPLRPQTPFLLSRNGCGSASALSCGWD